MFLCLEDTSLTHMNKAQRVVYTVLPLTLAPVSTNIKAFKFFTPFLFTSALDFDLCMVTHFHLSQGHKEFSCWSFELQLGAAKKCISIVFSSKIIQNIVVNVTVISGVYVILLRPFLLIVILMHKWAASWQNQQNGVRPAKTRVSLGICPAWSESSLCSQ